MNAHDTAPGIDPGAPQPSDLAALADRVERESTRGMNLLAALEVVEGQLWDHPGLAAPSDAKLIFAIAGVREALCGLLSDLQNRAVEAENREIVARGGESGIAGRK